MTSSTVIDFPDMGGPVCIDELFRENERDLYCTQNPLVNLDQYSSKFSLMLLLLLDHARKRRAKCHIRMMDSVISVVDQGSGKQIGQSMYRKDYVRALTQAPDGSSATMSATFAACVDFLLTNRGIRHMTSGMFRRMCKHIPESAELRSLLIRYVHHRDRLEMWQAGRGELSSSPLACLRRMMDGFLFLYMRVPYISNFTRALICSSIMAGRALSLACPYLQPMVYVSRQTSGTGSQIAAACFPPWAAQQFGVSCTANSPDVVAAMKYIEELQKHDARMRRCLDAPKEETAEAEGAVVASEKPGERVLMEHAQAYHTLVLESLGDREMAAITSGDVGLVFCLDNARNVQLKGCGLTSMSAAVRNNAAVLGNVTILSLLQCSVHDEDARFIAQLNQLRALHISGCSMLCSEPLGAIGTRFLQTNDDSAAYRPPEYLSLVENQSMRVYLPGLWRDSLTHLVLDRTPVDFESFRDPGGAEDRRFPALRYLSVLDNSSILNWIIARDLEALCISQVTHELAGLLRSRIDVREIYWTRPSMQFPLQLLPAMVDNSARLERLYVHPGGVDVAALRLMVHEHPHLGDVVCATGSPCESRLPGSLPPVTVQSPGFRAVDMRSAEFYSQITGCL